MKSSRIVFSRVGIAPGEAIDHQTLSHPRAHQAVRESQVPRHLRYPPSTRAHERNGISLELVVGHNRSVMEHRRLRGAEDEDDGTRERVRTLRTLLIAGMGLMVVGAVSALFRQKQVLSSVLTYVGMLIEHAIAYALARVGRLRLAVAIHVSLYLAMVAFAMWSSGGVMSPAGFVLPPIVLLAGLTWNGRAGMVTAAAAAALIVGFLVLESRGLLPRRGAPEPERLAFVIAVTLVITGAILAVALRTIGQARARALEHQGARLHAEERLAQARTLDTVAELAAGVAHDFNNVLMLIMGLAAEIAESTDERSVEPARGIQEAAKRAAALPRLLLAFGRGQSVELRTLDVNAVVREAEPLLRRFAGANRFVLELGEGLPAVRAEPTQLQQILLNLVGDARDAMPTSGLVTVGTARARAEHLARAPWAGKGEIPGIILQVTDTGDGMTPAVVARAFEPFFTTKARGKGTGIGLASVREIVEKSGGTIWAASEPGKGSCFTVLLRAVG